MNNNKIKEYRFFVILFIAEAVYMIMELVASRVLSPFFGSTNIVWTSVIGIILLSSSIGNYLGGKCADKEDRINILKGCLFFSGMFTMIVPLIETRLLQFLSIYLSEKIGAIIATMFLFFIPSLFLGMINPIILKLNIQDIDTAGNISGKIYSISTLGGIVGTFIGGFLLIPRIGSVHLLFGLAATLLILSLGVGTINHEKKNAIVIFITIACLALMSVYIFVNSQLENLILSGNTKVSISLDTEYGRVKISNRETTSGNIRNLNIDGGFESATYTDNEKKNDIVYPYLKYYDYMFKSDININYTLMIGGAGYNYPKYYISHYLDKKMDVVEIDADITKIARKFFYLDDLFSEYDLNNNKRLTIINEDGRTYLNKNQKKYDAILNDAFAGKNPAKTLTTIENVRNIKRSLNEDGVYLTNIIGAQEGGSARFIKAEMNTINQEFNYVYAVPCYEGRDQTEALNYMVIASNKELTIPDAVEMDIKKDEIILTDDYCPVESLTENY